MKKIIVFIFYILFAAPGLLPGQENLKVVMLGNSLVKEGQWENRFGENIHIDYASVIDFTSKQMSWILNWAVYPKNPDICVIMGAQEDFYLQIPPETIVKNIMEVCSLLKADSIQPIVTSIIYLYDRPGINTRIKHTNRRLAKTCSRQGITYIDLNRYVSLKKSLYAGYATDHRYLNRQGYKVIAPVIEATILEQPLPQVPKNKKQKKIRIEPVDPHYLSKERIQRILEQSPRTVHITMLGNSITEGGGDWNSLLGRNDVRNCGQGGYSTGQMRWHLDTTVIDAKPEICFIMGGVNDISIGVPEQVIFRNIKEITRLLEANHVKPVVQSTFYQHNNPVSYPIISRLNHQLRSYCKNNKIDFLDLNSVLSDENGLKEELTTDGTHLKEKGYALWSAVLIKYLEQF